MGRSSLFRRAVFAILALSLFAVAAQAPDAIVTANNNYDPWVFNSYGLKVSSVTNPQRVIVLKDGIWGIDDQNRIRFQLFVDGSLHLFSSDHRETVTIDAESGRILLNGRPVAVLR